VYGFEVELYEIYGFMMKNFLPTGKIAPGRR